MEPHVLELTGTLKGVGGGGGGRVHKFLFSTGQTFCQRLLFHIVAMSGLKRFNIVTHCYAVAFSIKTLFSKANNIFYSLENQT